MKGKDDYFCIRPPCVQLELHSPVTITTPFLPRAWLAQRYETGLEICCRTAYPVSPEAAYQTVNPPLPQAHNYGQVRPPNNITLVAFRMPDLKGDFLY